MLKKGFTNILGRAFFNRLGTTFWKFPRGEGGGAIYRPQYILILIISIPQKEPLIWENMKP